MFLLAIRGLRSAASLKQQVDAMVRGPILVDPRTQIRGLIEAERGRARMTFDAALDPRTQIRGLIEASSTTWTTASRATSIRGLRSAASLKRHGVLPRSMFQRPRSADSDPRPH